MIAKIIQYTSNLFFLFLILISCDSQPKSELDKSTIELKSNTPTTQHTELETDSITEWWNLIVFEKGGCLGGEQYVKENPARRESRQLVFSTKDWHKFSENDHTELTEFLITKLSDTTKTNVHTCPFFTATHGEMAVYSLQQIHKKNWFDFPNFQEYKDKEYKSATEQPQIWLQKLLETETNRKTLAELFSKELKQ